MNEQAQQLITDVGAKVLEYLEATEGFTVEQAPLLAQEIIQYGVWLHAVSALISLLGMVSFGSVGTIAWVRALRKENINSYGGCQDKFVVPAIIGCSVGTVCIVPLLINLYEIAKPLIAPRLYILEQIGKLF